MRSVWKYPLKLTDWQDVLMPKESEVLCVQIQAETPTIWVLVDPQAKKVRRGFRIIGTGWELADEPLGVYLGTVQLRGLVWHVFADERRN